MTWRTICGRSESETRKGFTLVELLVVIGIIALLIAILMPALSRARKQALTASCGSNERQVAYAAIAYANDWQQQLPTINGNYIHNNWYLLTHYARLPIIGFDTTTIVNMGTAPFGVGGWAYMMRDYMKNDFDVVMCPDGWVGRNDLLTKYETNIMHLRVLKDEWASSYLWMPHRDTVGAIARAQSRGGCFPWVSGGPVTTQDTPDAVARTASGRPTLLISVDFNGAVVPWLGGYASRACVAGNHAATDFRHRVSFMSSQECLYETEYDPAVPEASDPDRLPLGVNTSRIDCRVTWGPWQNVQPQYCEAIWLLHFW